MNIKSWLLVTYKVPPEPAARRIAIWRRLKAMGAIYLQNGVCVVPKTDEHSRQLKMVENDVSEMGGEAVILDTVALDQAQEEKVVARFRADRDDVYREFIGRCADFQREIAQEVPKEKFPYPELEEKTPTSRSSRAGSKKMGKLDLLWAELLPPPSTPERP